MLVLLLRTLWGIFVLWLLYLFVASDVVAVGVLLGKLGSGVGLLVVCCLFGRWGERVCAYKSNRVEKERQRKAKVKRVSRKHKIGAFTNDIMGGVHAVHAIEFSPNQQSLFLEREREQERARKER